MKKFYVLLTGIVFITNLVSAQEFPAGLAEELQAALDDHVKSTSSKGIAATIILSDNSEWTGYSGTRDGVNPVIASKLFNFGSQGKELTAATVFKLDEAGLLSIDDSIGKYLTGIPNLRTDLPVKRFLNHTTGIGEYWVSGSEIWKKVWDDRTAILSLDEAAHYIPEGSADADPQYKYTNTNALITALLVEKVTGNPVGEEIYNLVLKPLGITTSVFPVSDFDEGLLNGIWAYNNGNPGYRGDWPHDSYFTTRLAWNGRIEDAAHFCRALHTGNILNAKNSQMMYEEAPGSKEIINYPVEGIVNSYGYGVEMITFNGEKMVGHGGNGLGMSMAFHNREKNYTIAAAINVFDDNLDMADLFNALFTMVNAYDPTTGILPEQAGTSVKVYPNPASDRLYFASELSGQASVKIYDVQGALVLEQPVNGNVDVSGLQSGLYIIRVKDQERLLTGKFMKE